MWRRLHIGFFVLLLLSLWCWQPHIISNQWVLQLVISMGLVAVLYQQLRQPTHSSIVSLSAQGEWLDLEQQKAFTITSASRVTPWLLWIQLRALGGQQRHWCWLCKDAVSDDDFRRLARTIYRVQQGKLNAAV